MTGTCESQLRLHCRSTFYSIADTQFSCRSTGKPRSTAFFVRFQTAANTVEPHGRTPVVLSLLSPSNSLYKDPSAQRANRPSGHHASPLPPVVPVVPVVPVAAKEASSVLEQLAPLCLSK
jgi:hypothetical protein